MSVSASANIAESDCFPDAPHPRHSFELFGHGAAEQELLDAFRKQRLPQSLIIGGAEGIGKATLAWRFTRFLLAYPEAASESVRFASDLYVDPDHPASRKISALAHSDVFLLRRQWNTVSKRHFTEIRVDDVREMVNRFHQSSSGNGWRIGIIDCTEDLNRSSANAMLKLIEEPPPRSLFLFVANNPARVLPTIRSRSHMLNVSTLTPEEIRAAINGLGAPWTDYADGDLDIAIARGAGSVRGTLRALASDSSVLDEIEAIMAGLPRIDWGAVHALADAVSKRDATEDFLAVVAAVYDWLSRQVRAARGGQMAATGEGAGAQLDAGSLAPLAELWEKIATSVRQVETYNLDRRPFLLNLINDLASVAALRGK